MRTIIEQGKTSLLRIIGFVERGEGEWLALSFVLVLGLILRLGSPSMKSDLWYDETYSLIVAQGSSSEMLHRLLLGGDTNPPLYTVLLHFWVKLGDCDLTVKLFSVGFSLISLGAIYSLGKLLGGRRVGLYCAFLLAVSETAIRYSVEARPYSMFLAFGLLSTYFLLSAILDPALCGKRNRQMTAYTLTTLLLIYTHWFGLLVVFVQMVVMALYYPYSRQILRLYGAALLLITLGALPLLPLLSNQICLQNEMGGFHWVGNPGGRALLEVAHFMSGGEKAMVLTVLVFLLAGWLGQRQARAALHPRHRGFLLVYLFLPLLVVYGVSHLLTNYSFFVPRYFLPFSISLPILISLVLARAERKFAMIFLLLFMSLPVCNSIRNWRKPQSPYSQLASELSAQSNKMLIGHVSPMSYYPLRRYQKDQIVNERILWRKSAGDSYMVGYNLSGGMLEAQDLLDVETDLQRYKDFLLVVDALDQDQKNHELLTYIHTNKRFTLASQEHFLNLSVERYTVVLPNSAD